MDLAVQIFQIVLYSIGALFMITFSIIGVWCFIIFNKTYKARRIQNYLLEKIYQEKDFYISTINTNEQYFYHDLYNLAQKCFYDAITKLDVNKTVSPQEKNFFSEFYAYGIAGTVLRGIKTNMKNEPAKLAHGLKKIATQSETFAASLLNN